MKLRAHSSFSALTPIPRSCLLAVTLLCCCAFFFPPPAAIAFVSADNTVVHTTDSPSALAAELERAYQQFLDRGISNFIPLALFFIQQSRMALQQKKDEHAVLYAEYAKKVSPESPSADVALGVARWKANPLYLHRLIAGYAQALAHRLSPHNIEEFCFFVVSNSAVLDAVLLMMLAILTCITLVRTLPLAAHDLRHILPAAIPTPAVKGVLALILLLPLLLGGSLVVCCLYWIIVLFAYHTTRERIMLAAIVVLCSVLVPLLISVASLCMFLPQAEEVFLLWKAQHRYWTPQDIDALERLHERQGSDTDTLFTLGFVYAAEGNYRTAQKYYEKLLSLSPQDYRAHTNLGNVLLAMYNWDAAVQHYQEALVLAPARCAAAHFNLARAYQQRFLFKEAEQELEKAKQIDPLTVNWHLKIYSENYNRLLIHERLPVTQFWERGYRLFVQHASDIGRLWDSVCPGIPIPYAVPALLAALCWSALAARRKKYRIAVRCHLCGAPLCQRCQRSRHTEHLCSSCFHFLKKQETLGYTLKEEKVAAIKKYLRREQIIGIISAVLAPGADHIWKGRVATGSILLFLFLMLFAKMLSLFVWEPPLGFGDVGRTAEIFFLGTCCLLFWVIRVRSAVRSPTFDSTSSLVLKRIIRDVKQ